MQDALRGAVGEHRLDLIDATGMATALMGDSIATNAFLLGFAFQKGTVPLSVEAILRAMELNGVSVEMNKQAFNWGRLAAHDMSQLRAATAAPPQSVRTTKTLDALIADRARRLKDYQNGTYADRYLGIVTRVRAAEATVVPGSNVLADAVARNLYKLMAYKDEYEVARLYTDGTFAGRLGDTFDGDLRLSFHLAPPVFAQRDPVTGHLRKREFGGWMIHLFRALARLKFLRGTAFDPFGRTAERRTERRLIDDYEAEMLRHIDNITAGRIAAIIRLAELPQTIRGYGHIKDQAIARAAAERERIESELDNAAFANAAE
jgi:indolepyruvate ferredoxin oxidoreductase